MKTLNKKITGTINYYSLNGMIQEIRNIWYHAKGVAFKWLNRRSQRKSFKWDTFDEIWQERIVHPHIHVNIWNSTGVIYN